MRTAAGLDGLRAEAAAVTARGSRSFYFASRFFPEHMAQSAHAVYWFCRHTDDIVDEAVSQDVARTELEDWAQEVAAALATGTSSHPVLRLFVDAVQKHGIPSEYPMALIEGMRMDVRCTRYRTFEELRVFCYRVASVVGLMMSHVIGFRGSPLGYATDLGIAMQLTNILRDIAEDLGRGRIYLPSEELKQYGYSSDELRAHVRNDAFRQLMQFQIARAREYYERAMPGIEMLNREGRFAVRVAAEVYREILRSIEDNDYNVFEQRAVVPAATKYWLTARCMAMPVMRSSLRKLVARRA